MSSTPLRMARYKNLPDLVPADDGDSDNKYEENESDRLVVLCPRTVVASLKVQATPLTPIPD